MNKIYRLVWSRKEQALVVASEFARSDSAGRTATGKAAAHASLTLMGTFALLVSMPVFGGSLDGGSATAGNAVAIGIKAVASGGDATAVGYSTVASAGNAISVGNQLTAASFNSVVVGSASAQVTAVDDSSEGAIYIGGVKGGVTTDRISKSAGAVALGYTSSVTTSAGGIALGQEAAVSNADSGIAIGKNSSVSTSQGMAIGAAATASGTSAIAIGTSSSSTQIGTIAIGRQAAATNTGAVAIGDGASGAEFAVAAGSGAKAVTSQSIAIGRDATAGTGAANVATAIGNRSAATGAWSVALGSAATSGGISSTALGNAADASGARSVAIGLRAAATHDGSVALGNGAKSSATVATASGSIAGKTYTYAGSAPTGNVSVGSEAVPASGTTAAVAATSRTITNVAAGRVSTTSTDAINGSQLNATNTELTAVDDRVDAQGADTAKHLGGGASYDASTGRVSAPSYSVGGSKVANVGDAISNLDGRTTANTAVLDDIANGGGIKYFHANSTRVDSRATGTDSIAVGPAAAASATNAVAVGNGATASHANSIALGNGANTAASVGTASGTIAGTSYDYAGTAPTGTVSFGSDAVAATADTPAVAATNRTLTNVAAGRVSATSTDAINGSQLFATNQAVTDLDTRTDNLGSNVASNLGGGSTYDQATGKVSAPSYDVGGTRVNNVGDAVKNLDDRTTSNTTAITQLGDQLNSGEAGLVKATKDDEGKVTGITVAKDLGGSSVDFTGTDGARKLTGVADGSVAAGSKDAVNGSQLQAVSKSVADNLGGGSKVNPDGTVSAPSYSVGGTTVSNVGDAVKNLDDRTTSNTDAIAGNTTAINNIANGGGIKYFHANSTLADSTATGTDSIAVGPAAAASATNAVAVGNGATASHANSIALGNGAKTAAAVGTASGSIAGTSYDYAGTSPTGTVSFGSDAVAATADTPAVAATNRTLTNVAAGRVSATSTDAINGSQLNATNTELTALDGRVDSLGNNVASNLGGGSTYDQATGKVSAPSYDVGGTKVNNVGDAVKNLDDRTTSNTTAITQLGDQLNSGEAGLVKAVKDDEGKVTGITVAKDLGGSSVDFTGTDGARKLAGVAAGAVSTTSTEAINGSQLQAVSKSVADNLGGGSKVNPDGTVSAPSYDVGGTTVSNVGDAVKNLDDRTTSNTDAIAGNTTAINNITNGGGIKYFHANSTLADSAATGTDSIAVGPAATASATNAVAVGNGATASHANSIALGNGAKTATSVGTASGTIAGTSYDYAGTSPTGTVSFGSDAVAATADTPAVAATNRTLTNVAAGRVSATSTDAINGSQLNATNTELTALDGRVDNLGNNVASNLGGGSTYDQATGKVSAPSYDVGGTRVNNVGDAVKNLDDRTTSNTTAITQLGDQLNSGEAGLVKATKDDEGKVTGITVAKDLGGSSVDFTGTDGARKLTGVADGSVAAGSKDAVNGSQLQAVSKSVADNLGGGSKVNPDGTVSAPSYSVGGTTVSNVGDAVKNLDDRTTSNTDAIAGNTTAINNIANGGGIKYFHANSTLADSTATGTDSIAVGPAAAASATNAVAVGNGATASHANSIALGNGAKTAAAVGTASGSIAGTSYDYAGTSPTGTVSFGSDAVAATADTPAVAATNRTLTNVAAGRVSATSTDAINGSQLNATNTELTALDGRVDSLGNNVASNLGGGSTYDQATGKVSAPSYDVGGTKVNNVGDAVKNLDDRTTSNTTAITQLGDQLNSGEAGLVKAVKDDEGKVTGITVAKDLGGSSVDFTGTDGARKLAGVAAGAVSTTSTEAINGSQLQAVSKSVADNLGGGSKVNPDGTVSAPSYDVGGTTVSNVGDAVKNLDDRTTSNTDAIAGNTTAINNITNGGGIKYFHANSTLADSAATGTDSIAVGPAATASATNAVAVGNGATASHAESIALGAGSQTSVGAQEGYDAAFVGSSSSRGEVAIGGRKITGVAAGSADTDAVNVSQLKAGVVSAVDQAKGYTDARITEVVGTVGNVTGAIDDLKKGADGMFQVGQDGGAKPTASGQNAVAGGSNAQATGANSTALGANSQASGSNSVALGAGSVADRDNTVAVGSTGNERQVTHVAAGTADTDAVNVGQLRQSAAGTVRYDSNADGSVNPQSVTLNAGGAPAGLHNVADGVRPNDAVNMGQLNRAVGQLRADQWDIRRESRGGTASAMAMAGMPQATGAGRHMLAVGMGGYEGEVGMAVGLSGVTDNGRYVYKAQVSGNTSRDFGFSVGAGIQW